MDAEKQRGYSVHMRSYELYGSITVVKCFAALFLARKGPMMGKGSCATLFAAGRYEYNVTIVR